MASAASPGGTLLRASRVFSIPPPLQRPAPYLSNGKIFDSDTSTLPYPTQLSISTPASSARIGDWGFKRPLPRKSTRSKHPIINVSQIDTFEQITDWANAKAYTMSLRKWQEMDIALIRQPPAGVGYGVIMSRDSDHPESVFEREFDPVSANAEVDHGWMGKAKSVAEQIEAESRKERDAPANVDRDNRWRFKGPWVAGQTEAEFQKFLNTEVHDRKSEFRAYLRDQCAGTLRRARREKGTGAQSEHADQITAGTITDRQFTEYLKVLRSDKGDLYNKIRIFFDLPPAVSVNEESWTAMLDGARPQALEFKSNSPYAVAGPPKTHPSAGLYYTRTNFHMSNHHVYGPQENPSPIRARVVLPKNAKQSGQEVELGVGGFVTGVPGSNSGFKLVGNIIDSKTGQSKRVKDIVNIEPDTRGGQKAWIRPVSADVRPDGKVIVRIAAATENAIEAKTGEGPTTPPPPPFRSAERAIPLKRSEVGVLGGHKYGLG